MEKLQQDSVMPLEQHKQEVLAALDSATKGTPKGAAPDNNIVSEALTSAAGGSIFSAAVTAREESRSNGAAPKAIDSRSMFVGGAGGGKAAHVRTAIVPMGYAEKKELAREQAKVAQGKPARDGDIYARSQVAGQSLTGASSSGQKSSPIKGASVSPQAARAIEVRELQAELAVTNKEMQNPYQNGTKRLVEDLKKGNDQAEVFVQRLSESQKPRMQV